MNNNITIITESDYDINVYKLLENGGSIIEELKKVLMTGKAQIFFALSKDNSDIFKSGLNLMNRTYP